MLRKFSFPPVKNVGKSENPSTADRPGSSLETDELYDYLLF